MSKYRSQQYDKTDQEKMTEGRQKGSKEGDICKIFVGGLAPGTSDRDILEYFKEFGTISKHEFFISRGFGYVTFSSPTAVERVLAQTANDDGKAHIIKNKWVEVKKSYPPNNTNLPGKSESKGKGKEDSKGKGKKTSSTAPSTSGWGSTTNPKPVPAAVVPAAPVVTSMADGRNNLSDGRMKDFLAMGFSVRQCRRVLADCGWDVNKALDKLLEEGMEEEPTAPPTKTETGKSKTGNENVSTASGSIEDEEDESRTQKKYSKSPQEEKSSWDWWDNTRTKDKDESKAEDWGRTQNTSSQQGSNQQGSNQQNSSNQQGGSNQQDTHQNSGSNQQQSRPTTSNNAWGKNAWGRPDTAQVQTPDSPQQKNAPKVLQNDSQAAPRNNAANNTAMNNSTAPQMNNATANQMNPGSNTQQNGQQQQNQQSQQQQNQQIVQPKVQQQQVSQQMNQQLQNSNQGQQQQQTNVGMAPASGNMNSMPTTSAMNSFSDSNNFNAQQTRNGQNLGLSGYNNSSMLGDEGGLSGWSQLMEQPSVNKEQKSTNNSQQPVNNAQPAANNAQQNSAPVNNQGSNHFNNNAPNNLGQQQNNQQNHNGMYSGQQQHGAQNLSGQQQNMMYSQGGQMYGGYQGYGQNYYGQNQNYYQHQQQYYGAYATNHAANHGANPAISGNHAANATTGLSSQQMGSAMPMQQGQHPMQQMQGNESSEMTRVHVSPCQPYTPTVDVQSNQSFLKINEDLSQSIELILYNSNNSGWSFGKDVNGGQQGWFPTTCCQFDIVSSAYPFDTKPETTRPYISFQANQRIVIEKRHECGWWIGSVIENEQHGNLGPKGYFPGNFCQDQPSAQQPNPQTAG